MCIQSFFVSKQQPFIEAYLRFLRMAATVEALPEMADFGANERALFQEVLMAWACKAPLTVRQAIAIQSLGSPATLHKRLVRLRQMGLLEAVTSATDRRTKYLQPTRKGLDYVGKLGKAFAQSLAA